MKTFSGQHYSLRTSEHHMKKIFPGNNAPTFFVFIFVVSSYGFAMKHHMSYIIPHYVKEILLHYLIRCGTHCVLCFIFGVG